MSAVPPVPELRIAPGVAVGGGAGLLVVAGTCVVESRESALDHASALAEMAREAGVALVFKASFDKANRTSIRSFRGPGIARGLEILSEVRAATGLPLLTDVHEREHCGPAGHVCDILQIPAFLCRQTDLLVAAAETGRIVNVKKGQFLAPADAANIVEKLREARAHGVMLTERGASFGYNNLVVDMRAIPTMRGFGVPVVFDATHSVQRPGGQGTVSGGEPQFIGTLARAAVAAGADAVFMEVHRDPARALSDGANALRLDLFPALVRELAALHRLVRSFGDAPSAASAEVP